MTSVGPKPFDQQETFAETIREVVQSIRTLLSMEVAFVSHFESGRRVFAYVDCCADFCPIQVGDSGPIEDSYCVRVVDGRLPELLPDASCHPEALKLSVTRTLPVGAHMSVPIRFSDGRVFGTFCCFSRRANHNLVQRDIDTLRLFANFIGKRLEEQVRREEALHDLETRIRHVIDDARYQIVFQPIINVAEDRVVGFEGLTRFQTEPLRSPDQWFDDALKVGLQDELELAVMHAALSNLSALPEGAYLSLNISPATILKGGAAAVLAGHPLERIMLEVTEHVSVEDYSPIAAVLAPLRSQGLRLAVDDAGAGYASFRHILKLKPDVIKLDRSLISRIDVDLGSRALAAALVRFAEEMRCKVVAEGVETAEELAVLRALKINKAQGYLLGKPAPLSARSPN